MTPTALAQEVNDAFERLRDGIDLLNVLMVEQVLAHHGEAGRQPDDAAWLALRRATIFSHPQDLEQAHADLEQFSRRLWVLADQAEVDPSAGMHAAHGGNVGPMVEEEPDAEWAETRAVTDWLESISTLRDILVDLQKDPSRAAELPALRARADQARRLLDTPAARQAAVQALERRAEALFSASRH